MNAVTKGALTLRMIRRQLPCKHHHGSLSDDRSLQSRDTLRYVELH